MVLALLVFVGGCAGFHADPMYNHSPKAEMQEQRDVAQNPELLLWRDLFGGDTTEMRKPEKKGKNNSQKENSFWQQLKDDLFGPSEQDNSGDGK